MEFKKNQIWIDFNTNIPILDKFWLQNYNFGVLEVYEFCMYFLVSFGMKNKLFK